MKLKIECKTPTAIYCKCDGCKELLAYPIKEALQEIKLRKPNPLLTLIKQSSKNDNT